MNRMVYIIGFLVLTSFFLVTKFYTKDEAKESQIDYSFDLKEAVEIRKKLKEKDYQKVEALVKELNSDNLTQVVDCISLSLDESLLLDWYKKSGDKNIVNLFLGVHYNHKAWIARTYGYAEDVSEEQRIGFYEYQEKSKEKLLSVSNNSSMITEAYSRLIRCYMGYGEVETAREYFGRVMKMEKDNVWAYIHYSEVIQPKWGGNLTLISNLREEIRQRKRIIKYIVELKLILDSFIASENYFGGTIEDLKEEALKKLLEIDEEVSIKPLSSIHKYVVYNYLFALSEELGNHKLKNKNLQKMDDYYTLYPFGIIK